MKYKVGDKVRVREDLVKRGLYGGEIAVSDMVNMRRMTVTIGDVGEMGYGIEEDPYGYTWTDEMLEPVEEELTAEEAIRLRGEMCEGRYCSCCKLSAYNNGMGIICNELEIKHPERAIEILKRYKKDHEKKPIETEFALYVQIIEVDTHILKHEEKVETDIRSMDVQKAEILKKYCSEHDGKYYAISERRCVVKEQSWTQEKRQIT